jgi:hypothetical protein
MPTTLRPSHPGGQLQEPFGKEFGFFPLERFLKIISRVIASPRLEERLPQTCAGWCLYVCHAWQSKPFGYI